MRKNKISKINIIRAILIILLLATFIRIFCFSNQNGTQSSGVSRKVTEIVTSNIKKVQNMSKNERELFLEHTEKIIIDVCNELYSGNIDADPLVISGGSPCDYCDYWSVCGNVPCEKYREADKHAEEEMLKIISD